jgi:2-C-methyl-D-erythritol 4-phosphate cytidylyltransferase
MNDWGLILAAAGSGSRFRSETPKQFVKIEGRPLYVYSLRSFIAKVREMVVVVSGDRVKEVESQIKILLPHIEEDCHCEVVSGGNTRQKSVALGLERLTAGRVLVHDAARPYVSPDLISRVMAGVEKQGACVPALTVTDTVKQVDSGFVVQTLERTELVLAQTPQGFETDLLREAHRAADKIRLEGTDEASLVEKLGFAIMVVEGDPSNIKVTWPADLKRATEGSNSAMS